MADHNLDRQPGLDRLADDIKKLQQQISELRTLQLQGNNSLRPTVTTTFSMGQYVDNVPNNGILAGKFTLSSSDTTPLFAIPTLTFYEGSITAGKEIGYGNVRDVGYTWNSWLDWGDNDNQKLICRVWIMNKTGITQPRIFVVCNWRVILTTTATVAFT